MINQPYSHSGEKGNKMSDEELTKAIYEAMQVPYLSERHDAIKKLITQYATQCYKEGEMAGRLAVNEHVYTAGGFQSTKGDK